MDRARWDRIQELFHQSLERPAEERRAFLESACGDDAALMDQVQAMLTEDDTGSSVLDRELHEIAYEMVGETDEAAPAERVGPYQLIELLGEGGMGVVWLAERADLEKSVAMKLLPNAGLSPTRRERFQQEILTLAKLNHPYIAQLHDTGIHQQETPWFVMDYVKGQSFSRFCAEKKLSVEEILQLFRKVCEAVQYAHGQGTLHRDLKPNNILVEADGTPKLLDFGIARRLQELNEGGAESGGKAVEQTIPGLRFMSPPYAAPEWVLHGAISWQTDVYALGVMLYEVLTGHRPYEDSPKGPDGLPRTANGSRIADVAEKPSLLVKRLEMAGERNPAWALSKMAWNDLDVLCRTAMHVDLAVRYASVEALIRDVDHYLQGEPLEAAPDAWSYRVSKFVRRNRRGVLAVSLTVLLVVGLTIFYTVRLARARDAALAEAARTQRIQHFMLYMLGGSDLGAAPATDLRVVTLLDRSAKEADALSADPETQGELYENLGNMYDKLGQFPQAERLLMLALDRQTKALPANDPKIAETLSRVASVKGDEAQYAEAEKYAQRAVDMVAGKFPATDVRVVNARSTLGRVVAQAGDFKRAIAIVEPLVGIAPKSREEEYTLSSNLSTLAVSENALTDIEKSDAAGQRALELDRRIFGDAHPKVSEDLSNLAINKMAYSRMKEAEGYFRQSSAILRAWYGPDHLDFAENETLLARVLITEGKDAEAEGLLEKALSAQEKGYPGDDPHVALTLDALGGVEMRRGDLAKADATLTRAAEMYRRLHGDSDYTTEFLFADLGEVVLREKQYARAEKITGAAVKTMLDDKVPADAINVATAKTTWGRALLALKRYAEAEEELAAAYKIYKEQDVPDAADMKDLRPDLVACYTALHEPEKAKRMDAEIESASQAKGKAAISK